MMKNIGPTLVTTTCVGLLLMVQGNPSLFVIGFAVAGGSICSTCLRMDETAGLTKFELTAPVSRTTVVVEKYVLLFLLTVIGLIIGGVVSYVAGTMTGTLEFPKLIMYVSVAFSISLISGSLIIFFLFRFGMIKADFFTVICYAVPVGVFILALVAAKKLGLNIMAGSLYATITYFFPVLAFVVGVLTAIITVSVYRKKQF
nr:ABC-2 transporter permease [uncultured Dysosmobacter sp.]